jgi:curved DNA-binding protein CbpA
VDTFELLPTLAQGELSETSAPELVAAVFRSRASGTLAIETPEGVEIRTYFRAGDMCGTAPFEGFHTLAHVLLANDWCSALDIDSSREEAAQLKKRHGEILVGKGLLTQEQLRAALIAQHQSNLGMLLARTLGKYEWRGWEPPPAWAREVVVDPAAAMVNAFEQQHGARRGKVITWLGETPARLSLDWPELQNKLTLEPLERRAAATLALPRKLQEFVAASRLGEPRAEALLATLLLLGAAEPQPQATPVEVKPVAPPAPPPDLTPRPQSRPSPPLAAKILTPPAAAKAAPRPAKAQQDADLLDLVLEPLDPAHEELLSPLPDKKDDFPEPELQAVDANVDPLPPLELDMPSAPSKPPPQKQDRRAFEDHAMEQLDALLTDEAPLEIDDRRKPATLGVTEHHFAQQTAEPDAGRDLRKRMMQKGMRNLGGAPSLTAGTPLEGLEDPQPAAQPPRRNSPAVGSARAMNAEERIFAHEVQDRIGKLPSQNAYLRLGVNSNATPEAIKAAYLTLAKRFHPDRASGGLVSLQPDLQQLFGALKESYEQIATRDARAKYDEAQRAGASAGGKGNRAEEANTQLKMGEVLLKKRDFEGAIAKLRRSVDLEGNGDNLAALAWALVADPKATPATKEEAASLVQRALRAGGVTARTYYVAGVLWRTKDPDSAVDAFRKAIELDPNHSDAALELRLIEQRRGKQGKSSGGVLSGLLFGKRKG